MLRCRNSLQIPKTLAKSAFRRPSQGHVRRIHFSQPVREEDGEKYDPKGIERVEDEVDVCIVGAGPAGLSAAIRIKQLEREKGKEVRVVVLEKGGEVGECFFIVPSPRL
jgi:electron-transferring-flavoprotein dehydrogenase